MSSIVFVLLGVADLVFGHWGGAIFFIVMGVVLAIFGGRLGDKVLPLRWRSFLHPQTARGVGFFGICFASVALVGALVLLLLGDRAPAIGIAAFATLILWIGIREVANSR